MSEVFQQAPMSVSHERKRMAKTLLTSAAQDCRSKERQLPCSSPQLATSHSFSSSLSPLLLPSPPSDPEFTYATCYRPHQLSFVPISLHQYLLSNNTHWAKQDNWYNYHSISVHNIPPSPKQPQRGSTIHWETQITLF